MKKGITNFAPFVHNILCIDSIYFLRKYRPLLEFSRLHGLSVRRYQILARDIKLCIFSVSLTTITAYTV